MPPIGFALGIAVAVRFSGPRAKHGAAIIAVSILASGIWIVIVTSGALSTPASGY